MAEAARLAVPDLAITKTPSSPDLAGSNQVQHRAGEGLGGGWGVGGSNCDAFVGVLLQHKNKQDQNYAHVWQPAKQGTSTANSSKHPTKTRIPVEHLVDSVGDSQNRTPKYGFPQRSETRAKKYYSSLIVVTSPLCPAYPLPVRREKTTC